MPELNAPNQVWCYDFLFDACGNGQRLKVLSIEDEYTRESLAIEVATSLTSRQVIAILERLVAERGAPSAIRSDNGSEFIARSVQQWLEQRAIQAAFIAPGCPWQHGRGESFNGRLRDECLNLHWFRNLAEARVMIESWRRHYNEQRPHSSLQDQTPSEFRQWAEALRVELRT
jgi:putative transposase